ncbi:cytochrome b [Agromyces larvae]|uniref:Cytochrome b/b6 domain-containing protein n=1 Tax=Agromyces larvae TaxID=2929802 RepID=A0ABY4BZ10_9MICO|nr:cytochrome b/b6 domain-containing protein [Agromyces larvae]UOE44139.1 cytochrome b/b6 domain-containing protein [Agromyces larvae]
MARDLPPRHGAVARVLHWLTVAALLAQYLVGYAMTGAEGVLEPWIEAAYDGDEDLLLPVHVAIGCSILALTVVRFAWRRIVTLPPWPATVSRAGRRFASITERALYALLVVTPASGLALVLLSGEDWEVGDDVEWRSPLDVVDDDLLVGVHVTSQILLLVAIALHVGFVLKHQVVDRDRFVRRMV